MKEMILTGLATEQRFNDATPLYFLVFNDGELKVPVSQEAAEIVVGEMYKTSTEEGPPIEDEEYEDQYNYQPKDEAGVDQV